MKKYELDKNDSIEVNGHTLYRVIYTDNFIEAYKKKFNRTITRKGGYVESEDNLSQDDYAVIRNESKAYENARIFGNSFVAGYSEMFGQSTISGYAEIYNTKVGEYTRISDFAKLWDMDIKDNLDISGTAHIINLKLDIYREE